MYQSSFLPNYLSIYLSIYLNTGLRSSTSAIGFFTVHHHRYSPSLSILLLVCSSMSFITLYSRQPICNRSINRLLILLPRDHLLSKLNQQTLILLPPQSTDFDSSSSTDFHSSSFPSSIFDSSFLLSQQTVILLPRDHLLSKLNQQTLILLLPQSTDFDSSSSIIILSKLNQQTLILLLTLILLPRDHLLSKLSQQTFFFLSFPSSVDLILLSQQTVLLSRDHLLSKLSQQTLIHLLSKLSLILLLDHLLSKLNQQTLILLPPQSTDFDSSSLIISLSKLNQTLILLPPQSTDFVLLLPRDHLLSKLSQQTLILPRDHLLSKLNQQTLILLPLDHLLSKLNQQTVILLPPQSTDFDSSSSSPLLINRHSSSLSKLSQQTLVAFLVLLPVDFDHLLSKLNQQTLILLPPQSTDFDSSSSSSPFQAQSLILLPPQSTDFDSSSSDHLLSKLNQQSLILLPLIISFPAPLDHLLSKLSQQTLILLPPQSTTLILLPLDPSPFQKLSHSSSSSINRDSSSLIISFLNQPILILLPQSTDFDLLLVIISFQLIQASFDSFFLVIISFSKLNQQTLILLPRSSDHFQSFPSSINRFFFDSSSPRDHLLSKLNQQTLILLLLNQQTLILLSDHLLSSSINRIILPPQSTDFLILLPLDHLLSKLSQQTLILLPDHLLSKLSRQTLILLPSSINRFFFDHLLPRDHLLSKLSQQTLILLP
ncbi:unnamed protein product [Acanthosepion pharaonis]|uniref:Uncharacterized protein n=1 Tax=Acanthosepion pharaonis TaxID=158019 RepID=A0A812EH21_ACAPH|nr:unnamed protein product [Sepia pharaonis]